MIKRLWFMWCTRYKVEDDLGRVERWNPVIAEHHLANTERMLLGWCGKPKVVGNRVADAREERIRKQREQEQGGETVRPFKRSR
jgi:hypothetical protein